MHELWQRVTTKWNEQSEWAKSRQNHTTPVYFLVGGKRVKATTAGEIARLRSVPDVQETK